jgi:hypothetical protein
MIQNNMSIRKIKKIKNYRDPLKGEKGKKIFHYILFDVEYHQREYDYSFIEQRLM